MEDLPQRDIIIEVLCDDKLAPGSAFTDPVVVVPLSVNRGTSLITLFWFDSKIEPCELQIPVVYRESKHSGSLHTDVTRAERCVELSHRATDGRPPDNIKINTAAASACLPDTVHRER
ncbi:hypothetical protein J6590_005214 [Homalodisca vitripennis]|nr:hypothetical protein J6590_005214 [Homalodisca vitripennis]